MRTKIIKTLLLVFLLSLAACGSDNVEPELANEPTLAATEVSPTEVVAEVEAEVEEEAISTPNAEPTVAPEPTPVPTLRSIETSGPINDPGPLLDEYMNEGLFISHFDSADTELWWSYSQDSEISIFNADESPPEGFITSANWHAKQTEKWVMPTDDLNFQSDKMIAGDGAAIWSDTVLSTRLTVIDIPHDWSEYAFLSFWAYSSNANDAGIQLAIYSELD